MSSPTQRKQFVDQINAHRKILYKLTFVYCRRSDDRKDLIQEMLIQLWRSYERFDGRVKFSTWMYRVAANTAISFYRQGQRSEPEFVSIEELGTDIAAADEAFDESGDSMQTLRRLIDAMDEVNMALLLMYLDGCSHEDIAASSGTSVSNGGTRISRIKQKLKDSLTCGENMELDELKLAWQHARCKINRKTAY